MEYQKQRCEEKVWDSSSWHSYQCTRNAKVERDGKHYCTIHDPIRIKEKQDKKHKKWKEKFEKESKDHEYQYSAVAYCKKKGFTIDELKDALSKDGLDE